MLLALAVRKDKPYLRVVQWHYFNCVMKVIPNYIFESMFVKQLLSVLGQRLMLRVGILDFPFRVPTPQITKQNIRNAIKQ